MIASPWGCMLRICFASHLRLIRGRGCGGHAIVTQSNALCISTSRLLRPPHRPHSQLSCTCGGEDGGPQINLSRIGAVRLQRADAVLLPRHGMKRNSQSMRRTSVAQCWLYLRTAFVITCSSTLLASQLFAMRLRWSRDRYQSEYNLQKYFAARPPRRQRWHHMCHDWRLPSCVMNVLTAVVNV